MQMKPYRRLLREHQLNLLKSLGSLGVSLGVSCLLGMGLGTTLVKPDLSLRILTLTLFTASVGVGLVLMSDVEEDIEDLLEVKRNRKVLKNSLGGLSIQNEPLRIPEEPLSAPRGLLREQVSYEGGNLVAPLKSTLIVGQPGAGKGLLMYEALLTLKKSRPNLKIFGIPVKNDPDEIESRWGICDRLYVDPLPSFGDTEDWIAGAEEFVQEFADQPGEKLLVIDEALALKERTKAFWKGFVSSANHLASTGRSIGCYVWIASQTPNAGDLGVSGGARNVFRRILVVHFEDVGVLQNRTTFATYPTDSELRRLFKKSPRIVYDSLGDKWEPLGEISDPSQGIYKEPENPEGVTKTLQRIYETSGAPGRVPEDLWELLKTPRAKKDIQRYWGKEKGLTPERLGDILKEHREIRFNQETQKYERDQ